MTFKFASGANPANFLEQAANTSELNAMVQSLVLYGFPIYWTKEWVHRIWHNVKHPNVTPGSYQDRMYACTDPAPILRSDFTSTFQMAMDLLDSYQDVPGNYNAVYINNSLYPFLKIPSCNTADIPAAMRNNWHVYTGYDLWSAYYNISVPDNVGELKASRLTNFTYIPKVIGYPLINIWYDGGILDIWNGHISSSVDPVPDWNDYSGGLVNARLQNYGTAGFMVVSVRRYRATAADPDPGFNPPQYLALVPYTVGSTTMSSIWSAFVSNYAGLATHPYQAQVIVENMYITLRHQFDDFT